MLPTTKNDFENYIIETRGRILSMSDEIVDEIHLLHGKDKVNCWIRCMEVLSKITANVDMRRDNNEENRKLIRNIFITEAEAEDIEADTRSSE